MGELQTHSALSKSWWATGFHSYHVFKGACFQGYCRPGKREMDIGKFKCHRAYSSRESAIFLANLWLISSVLKMLILTIFATALTAFMKHHSGSVSSS